MRRSAPLNFTIRFPSRLLHKLLQAIADRAYSMGHEDGSAARPPQKDRVIIDPSKLRKLL